MRIDSLNKFVTISIDTKWSGDSAPYTKELTIEGIEDTDIVNIYPIWSENIDTRKNEKNEYNKISMCESIQNGIKLTCDNSAPTMNLTIRVEVL